MLEGFAYTLTLYALVMAFAWVSALISPR